MKGIFKKPQKLMIFVTYFNNCKDDLMWQDNTLASRSLFIPSSQIEQIGWWMEGTPIHGSRASNLPEFSSRRKDVVTFWGNLGKMTDTSGESRFPTISKLSKTLLSLPHSNADVERIFSQVTLIKTKTRNKLKTETLDALILVKQGLPCVCKCINV